jgi:hypothetical protein
VSVWCLSRAGVSVGCQCRGWAVVQVTTGGLLRWSSCSLPAGGWRSGAAAICVVP